MSQEYPKQIAPEEMGSRITYKVVTVANPAVGANFTENVPAGKMWEILNINFILTTDATVTNRFIKIHLSDGVTEFDTARTIYPHPTSLSVTYSFTNTDSSSSTNANNSLTRWVPTVVKNGGIVKSHLLNGGAGDAFTAITLYVKEIDIA